MKKLCVIIAFLVASPSGSIRLAAEEAPTILCPTDTTLMPTDTVAANLGASDVEIERVETVSTVANPYKFRPVQVIAPAALIGVGIVGLESDWLKYQNREIRDEMQENIDRRLSLDDFSQYAPAATVYALDLFGVKGMHDVVDQTVILATAYALMGISVNSLKTITRVERPDGSSRNSFPSGHTATAFMGAEFLRREYAAVSPWIGVGGYAVAIGTGFFRMYNNRHWLNDVLAGAGLGILCADAAYWLYPFIAKTVMKRRYARNVWLSPLLGNNVKALTLRLEF